MKILSSIIFGIGIATTSLPSLGDESGNLLVKLTGFESSQGKVMIALSRNEAEYKFKTTPYRNETLKLENKTSHWELDALPYGTYAIRFFHDENSNSELDTNFMGIPKEDYGFSNDAPARFGPPKFDMAKFVYSESVKVISINVQ